MSPQVQLAAGPTEKDELIWGAAAIADEIGRERSATFHMLNAGVLPAKKVGGRWVMSRRRLREFFENIAG